MTTIEWTDETWNPVTGCSKVSPGCDNCYMFALYPRLSAMGVRGYEATPDTVTVLPERLEVPLRWTRPRLVFVNSMSDLFHPRVPLAFIGEVFDVMGRAEAHVFQVLTKRPHRMRHIIEKLDIRVARNVWLGVSAENQKFADSRLPPLLDVPCAVRFVSAEPLLGPLDLSPWLHGPERVDWLIVGGESGAGARPMDLEWARSLRDQASAAGVAYFLKQLGGVRGKRGHDEALLDGRLWREMPGEVGAA